jgi:hypothetical protein
MPPIQIASAIIVHASGDLREGVLSSLQVVPRWRLPWPACVGGRQDSVQKMASNFLNGLRDGCPSPDRVAFIQQLTGVITRLVGVADQR